MADPNCSRCAIEAEVRKDDEALIRQMLEALKQFQYRACESIHPDFVDEAITAGRARLGRRSAVTSGNSPGLTLAGF